MHRVTVPFCLFLASLVLSPVYVDATSFGLYHLSARQAASNCTVPRLPWNLCTVCKLKPFDGKGSNLNFGGINRFDIYDLSTPRCMAMMQRYVKFNPCDTLRAKALANIDKLWGYKTMTYFMYSICETCCDCIPIGSREDEYEERSRNGKLIHVDRGNCAAHFYYDTCRIWPNARQITGLYGKVFKHSDHPRFQWCSDFKRWQFSPNARGWLRNNNVKGLTQNMRRAMRYMSIYGRCREKTQWQNCVKMERAQFRV